MRQTFFLVRSDLRDLSGELLEIPANCWPQRLHLDRAPISPLNCVPVLPPGRGLVTRTLLRVRSLGLGILLTHLDYSKNMRKHCTEKQRAYQIPPYERTAENRYRKIGANPWKISYRNTYVRDWVSVEPA